MNHYHRHLTTSLYYQLQPFCTIMRSRLNKSIVLWTDARGLDLMLVSIRCKKEREKKCTILSCFSFRSWVDSFFPAHDQASEPRRAFFAVFVHRNICLHRHTNLRLWCSPTSKRCQLIAYEEALGNILIGGGSSNRPMCSNEKAYVFLSEGVVAPLRSERLQRLYVR